jgi:hypothetical protein
MVPKTLCGPVSCPKSAHLRASNGPYRELTSLVISGWCAGVEVTPAAIQIVNG